MTGKTATWLGAAALASAWLLGACSGDAGPGGEPGPSGAPGATGATGAPGADGVGGGLATAPDAGFGSAACTLACHTMGGVVDQWRFSNHSHPQESEVGGGTCGNCHGLDGIALRVAGGYTASADAGTVTNVEHGHLNYRAASGAVTEINYSGTTSIGRIHCTSCHEFNSSTDPHVTGSYAPHQAPIRVPGGPADSVYLETTPAGGSEPVGQSLVMGTGNLCAMCHKSRKDVTFFITASNTISSAYWGPHNGPQTDIYSGKGGYQFVGSTYGGSEHITLENACVSCHMQPVPENGGMPDHTMKPSLTLCKTCHSQYKGTTFDVQRGQSKVRAALTELQTALNAEQLLTRSGAPPYGALAEDAVGDGQFHLDKTRPSTGPDGGNQTLTAKHAGALYNYLLIARSKDYGVHNPTYTKQLLWDSILEIKGSAPTSMPEGRAE